MFITFEGLDYSGKTTQVKLLEKKLIDRGKNVLLIREPGGTPSGERIRELLLRKSEIDIHPLSELFLFSASRAQLVHDVIRPALSKGTVIICDRFFDSTTAYQGGGRELSLEVIKIVNTAATSGLDPDITFFLDIPVEEVEQRIKKNKAGKDRMESSGKKFYERVRKEYLHLAETEKRFLVINGLQSIDLIHDVIWEKVCRIVIPEERGEATTSRSIV